MTALNTFLYLLYHRRATGYQPYSLLKAEKCQSARDIVMLT